MKPALSVLLPVYNARPYLQQALDSLHAQTFQDFEIIAVDDGSSDGSRELLEQWAPQEPRLRLLSRPNTGVVGARNDALALARGEFVAMLDADDVCLPERLEKQIAYLRAHPDCVCLGSAFLYIDSAGCHLKAVQRLTDHAAIEQALLRGDGGAIIQPSAMFRRAAIERVGGYREAAQWIEDLDLYLRLAQVGALANLAEVLVQYRFHESSVNFTRNHGRRERQLAVVAEACAARGLEFDAATLIQPHTDSAISIDQLREFAITSLQYGKSGRPWYYAFRALRCQPASRASWRTLSFVVKHRLGWIRN